MDFLVPQSKQRQIWKYVLIAIGFGLLVVLVSFRRDVLVETYEVLKDIDLRYVIALPLLQLLSYMLVAGYYKQFFKAFKKQVNYLRMLGIVLSLTFVDQVLPSGGLSGTTYLVYGLRHKLKVGTITLAHLGRYMISYLSYFLILATALLFLLYGEGQVNQSVYGYLVTLMSVAIVFGVFFLWTISSYERVNKYLGALGRGVDYLSRKFRGGKEVFGEDLIVRTAQEFYSGFDLFRSDARKLIAPISLMMLAGVVNVFIVYFSFVAIGYDLNPGAIIFSFAVANAVGVLSVVPGDFGVHEGTMVAMLTLTGSPVAEAISATLLYRIFVKFVFLPLNFSLYTKLIASRT